MGKIRPKPSYPAVRMCGVLAAVLSLLLLVEPCMAFGPASHAAAGDEALKNDLERAYLDLTKVALDTGSGVPLQDYHFSRDCLEVTFEKGTLFLARPIEGQVTGAAYVGSGRVRMVPPCSIEKAQLEREIDACTLDLPFTAAFFRFDDGTDEVFRHMLASGATADAARAGEVFENRGKALMKLKNNVEFTLLEHRLSGSPNGDVFFAEFDTDPHGWISFVFNPDAEEEVSLFKHTKGGSLGETRNFDLWCSFDQKEDCGKPEAVRYKKNKDLIEIQHVTMDLRVMKKSLVLDNDVSLELTSRVDGLNTLRFGFIHEGLFGHRGKVIVESIVDSAGNELEYVHRNHEILIRLARTLDRGDEETLRFIYEGDIIAPIFVLGDMSSLPGAGRGIGQSGLGELDFLPSHPVSYQLTHTYPWFPYYGYLRRYTIDWTVRVPKPNLPVVCGDTVREWEEEDYNCVQTTFDTPVLIPCFIFGEYYKLSNAETKSGNMPVINVYSLAKQKGERQKILEEAENIVEYLQSLYGPYPYGELDIAQMSFFMGFGQAPPGLVQLTGEAFLTEAQIANVMSLFGSPGSAVDFRSPFLAHEIGHEWWAHKVGWRTYHDQWLSEAFTEYSSGMYMTALKGGEQMARELDGWRENAMQVKDDGPISLGFRLDDAYFDATYQKGPYVLHMLRMALISQFGPDEGTTRFIQCLKNFIDAYPHQNPTTTDFQRVVNRTVGMDMDWFFDQWFRGAGIPTFHFSYDTRRTEDGKWLVEGRIRQEDTDNPVSVVMPVYFEFGRKQYSDQLLWVNKPDFTFKTKLPEKPKKVVLNKTEDILCEVIRE